MVVIPFKRNPETSLKTCTGLLFKEQLNQGMSLVAVMVGVAILGILAVVLSEVFKSQFSAQKDLDLKVARMAVIRNVNARIQEYCPPGGPLPWVPAVCGARTYLSIPRVRRNPDSSAGQPEFIIDTNQPAIIGLFDPNNELNAHRMGNILVRAFCDTNAAGQRELKIEAVSERDLANRVPNTGWRDISLRSNDARIPLACNIHR